MPRMCGSNRRSARAWLSRNAWSSERPVSSRRTEPPAPLRKERRRLGLSNGSTFVSGSEIYKGQYSKNGRAPLTRGFFEGSRSQARRIDGAPPEPRPGPRALAGGAQHHAFATGGASRGRGGGWGRKIRRIG